MHIPVSISGEIHYLARWRVVWSALTGRPARAHCGYLVQQATNPPGIPCWTCARRAGEPRL